MRKLVLLKGFAILIATTAMNSMVLCQSQLYKIVGTGQTNAYNNSGLIATPTVGQSFYGQNANHPGNTPSYTDNGDGTVTDNITGLMWEKTPDKNSDGIINYYDKKT